MANVELSAKMSGKGGMKELPKPSFVIHVDNIMNENDDLGKVVDYLKDHGYDFRVLKKSLDVKGRVIKDEQSIKGEKKNGKFFFRLFRKRAS
jgi:hypothetical protein